jgi:hypothetical protein
LAISICTAVLSRPFAVRFARTRVPSEASNRTDFGGAALRWVSSRSPSHPACAAGSASCSNAALIGPGTVLEALALNVPSGRCPGSRRPRSCSYPTVIDWAHQPSISNSLTSIRAIAVWSSPAASRSSKSASQVFQSAPVPSMRAWSDMVWRRGDVDAPMDPA